MFLRATDCLSIALRQLRSTAPIVHFARPVLTPHLLEADFPPPDPGARCPFLLIATGLVTKPAGSCSLPGAVGNPLPERRYLTVAGWLFRVCYCCVLFVLRRQGVVLHGGQGWVDIGPPCVGGRGRLLEVSCCPPCRERKRAPGLLVSLARHQMLLLLCDNVLGLRPPWSFFVVAFAAPGKNSGRLTASRSSSSSSSSRSSSRSSRRVTIGSSIGQRAKPRWKFSPATVTTVLRSHTYTATQSESEPYVDRISAETAQTHHFTERPFPLSRALRLVFPNSMQSLPTRSALNDNHPRHAPKFARDECPPLGRSNQTRHFGEQYKSPVLFDVFC